MNRRGLLKSFAGLFALPLLPKIEAVAKVAEPSIITAYKGVSVFDSGLYCCPYIPLQRASADVVTAIQKTKSI